MREGWSKLPQPKTLHLHEPTNQPTSNYLRQLPVQLLQLAQELPLHVPLRVEQIALRVCFMIDKGGGGLC